MCELLEPNIHIKIELIVSFIYNSYSFKYNSFPNISFFFLLWLRFEPQIYYTLFLNVGILVVKLVYFLLLGFKH